jgi:hypothetical protein
MNYIGSSPRCACGQHYLSTIPTDHFCRIGTAGTATQAVTEHMVYVIPPDDAYPNGNDNTPIEFKKTLQARYQPQPEPREREQRKRWIEDHARKYAGRRA